MYNVYTSLVGKDLMSVSSRDELHVTGLSCRYDVDVVKVTQYTVTGYQIPADEGVSHSYLSHLSLLVTSCAYSVISRVRAHGCLKFMGQKKRGWALKRRRQLTMYV